MASCPTACGGFNTIRPAAASILSMGSRLMAQLPATMISMSWTFRQSPSEAGSIPRVYRLRSSDSLAEVSARQGSSASRFGVRALCARCPFT